MYTEEYTGYNNEQYEDYNQIDENNEAFEEEENTSFWKKNRNIIAKIIVIILCLIILIWLIAKLTRKNNNNTEEVLDSNFTSNMVELRKASEKYFFIENNLKTTQAITLNDLVSAGRVNVLNTSTGEMCDASNSYAVVTTTNDYYEMAITLKCGSNNKTETYYYNNDETKACINCGGDTLMDGTTGYLEGYSCDEWSEWTTERKESNFLTERTKTMVRAEKKSYQEEKITYGEWSEYTETGAVASDTLEVQTKQEDKWVTKTSGTKPTESDSIRNITEAGSDGYYKTVTSCPKGYSLNKTKTLCTGTHTTSEWMSYGKSSFSNCRVDGSVPAKWTCSADTTTSKKWVSGSTVYTYEEKTTVTTYSTRTVTKEMVTVPYDSTDLIEISEIPDGYTKINGSEVIYYSYKLNSCEK